MTRRVFILPTTDEDGEMKAGYVTELDDAEAAILIAQCKAAALDETATADVRRNGQSAMLKRPQRRPGRAGNGRFR